MSMLPRTLYIGTTYQVPVTFYDADGNAEDMTGKTGVLRMRLSSAADDGAVAYERSTDTTAEFTWTDRSNGEGRWEWSNFTGIPAGAYDAEVYRYTTADSSDRRRVGGPVLYEIKNPETGPF